MQIWFKLVKDNHILREVTITDDSDDTRTHKVMRSVDQAIHELDIGVPSWLPLNIKDFKRFAKTRFTADSFIEGLEGDYLEMEVIEED
ncbi:MAG: hypothetical protein DUD27_00240 [Lachnospiraceae bacterium]|uniref:Uncharacterized protein n=1 Tax=Candidatus Weimeria bifida TaxID=2599074 RepID=A0A6N7J3I3_9FIRM|nr:hypothetical protein [Candidatus Weimeria bifida]RRF97338.1 MAG: hypothetical protein DUD27_00240 [Lachnospiraceae bacterium]